MKKDILILSSFFEKNLIESIYFSDKTLKNINYIEQIKVIKKKSYFSRIDLNHFFLSKFESFEIFVGAEIALKKLCTEEKIIFSSEEKVILDLINRWQPKIIIFRDINCFSIKKLLEHKNSNNLTFKTILLNGFPIRNEKDYYFFDCVVFRNPWLIDNFSNICKKTYLIYHCFNSEILKKINLKEFEDKTKTITFDGSSYSDGFYSHKKRYYYLYNLISQKLITANIYEKNNFFHKLSYYLYLISVNLNNSDKIIIQILKSISKSNQVLFKKYYKRLDSIIENIENFNSSKYEKFYRGPLSFNFKKIIGKPNFGLDYYENINDSKLCLNIHTEAMGNTAGNIRLFEITGMQSCMLTENFKNVKDLFEPDKEIITYDNFNDLKDKIQFLTNNKNLVKEVSINGHKRLKKDHTDKIRSAEYLKLINDLI